MLAYPSGKPGHRPIRTKRPQRPAVRFRRAVQDRLPRHPPRSAAFRLSDHPYASVVRQRIAFTAFRIDLNGHPYASDVRFGIAFRLSHTVSSLPVCLAYRSTRNGRRAIRVGPQLRQDLPESQSTCTQNKLYQSTWGLLHNCEA